ncbi:collagen-like protein, partial [Listeria monocytogenes]
NGSDGKDGKEGGSVVSVYCSGGSLVVKYCDGVVSTVSGSVACQGVKPSPIVTISSHK